MKSLAHEKRLVFVNGVVIAKAFLKHILRYPNVIIHGIITLQSEIGDTMLNYANLNDAEFEALCKDVIERKLNVSLRRFAPGKDGGVDLTDDVVEKNIVVQVKHYRNSTTAQLVNSLKKNWKK